jgi:hypothetical protein
MDRRPISERKSIVHQNALKNPNYAPYCMRCKGLKRMIKTGTLSWGCSCGASHKEPIVGQFGPTTKAESVNLHLLTIEDAMAETPYRNLKIEFTGSADQCEEYATDDDYEWRESTNLNHYPCGGFYLRQADQEMQRDSTCLIPIPKE